MAMPVFVAWMRSRIVFDQFAFPLNEHQCNVFSADGSLSLFSMNLDPQEEGVVAWWSGTKSESDPSTVQVVFMVYRINKSKWTVPYLSIVAPLTLLSTFLVLWKPRKRPSPN